MTQDQSYYQPNAASQAYADWLGRNIIEPIMPQPYTNPGTYRVYDRDTWAAAVDAWVPTYNPSGTVTNDQRVLNLRGTSVPIYGTFGKIYDFDTEFVHMMPDGKFETVLRKGREEETMEPPDELVKLLEK